MGPHTQGINTTHVVIWYAEQYEKYVVNMLRGAGHWGSFPQHAEANGFARERKKPETKNVTGKHVNVEMFAPRQNRANQHPLCRMGKPRGSPTRTQLTGRPVAAALVLPRGCVQKRSSPSYVTRFCDRHERMQGRTRGLP